MFIDWNNILTTTGHSNRMIEKSCYNEFGFCINEQKLLAIKRWDRIEDIYLEYQKIK